MAAAWNADEEVAEPEAGDAAPVVEDMSASDGALPGGLSPDMVMKLTR